MIARSVNEIVEGYFRYLESKDEQRYWAWLAVDEECHNLASGMRLTLKLIESAPTKWHRDCVAAHALEDIVFRHGILAVREIDRFAKDSDALRLALPVINVDGDGETFKEWNALLARYKETQLNDEL